MIGKIDVAGAFDIDFELPKQKDRLSRAAMELCGVLMMFLPGDKNEQIRIISEMFQEAKFSRGVLRFSFPKKIKEKYGLKAFYRVRLRKGHPTLFYAKELVSHRDNGCDISIKNLSDEEMKWFFARFEKMSVHHRCLGMKKINITKWRGTFGMSVELSSGGRIKSTNLHSLEDVMRVLRGFKL